LLLVGHDTRVATEGAENTQCDDRNGQAGSPHV
jgi:hypothetical protein